MRACLLYNRDTKAFRFLCLKCTLGRTAVKAEELTSIVHYDGEDMTPGRCEDCNRAIFVRTRTVA